MSDYSAVIASSQLFRDIPADQLPVLHRFVGERPLRLQRAIDIGFRQHQLPLGEAASLRGADLKGPPAGVQPPASAAPP